MTEKIGIIADRGLPEKHLKALFRQLQDGAINHETGEKATLYLRIGSFPMDEEGSVMLHDTAPGVLRRYGWDRLIYVTDLPLTTRRPVISQSVDSGRATMLCLPAFGLLRARIGLRQELLRLVRAKRAGAGVREKPITDYDDIQGGDVDAEVTRVLEGRGRSLRLLLGMIRCNRPFVLLRVLSRSVALGVATGGFGIFYGSVWKMSNLMPIWRLGLVTAFAIAALTFWLIYNNGLWNQSFSKTDYDSVQWWRARWDNYATLITVAITAFAMYLILILFLLIMAAALVPIPYFSLQIEGPVQVWDYILLAWFAASLGMIGGALGSGFDSEEAIQEATYNRRELERRKLAGVFAADASEDGDSYDTDHSVDVTPKLK